MPDPRGLLSPQDYRYDQGLRYEEDEPVSPEILSPMTGSSRPSTLSSVGSIPDFPAPAQMGPGRRSANLGPPPLSRRGASSYYSQASFVSPIPEESPRPSHQSYASSAAIPRSWGAPSPRDDEYREGDYDDEEIRDYARYQNGPIDEARGESRGSSDDSDDRDLIRRASFGRRAKPSVIMNKSSERAEHHRAASSPQTMSSMALTPTGLTAPRPSTAPREAAWSSEDRVSGGTGSADTRTTSSSSTHGSDSNIVTINEPAATYHPTSKFTPKTTPDPNYLVPSPAASLRTPSPGFSTLSAIRRPPRLDINAVRDAEARGSLTSLPDLIKRATTLAAMMDVGKRPGSRMALGDFGSEDDYAEAAREKEIGVPLDQKHKSTLSGMLAAFPPPGLSNSRNGIPLRRTSTSLTDYDPSSPRDPRSSHRKRRRCCGLPPWGFLLLVFVVLVAAAAAVVVPLEFFVFRKARTAGPAALSALQTCENNPSTRCQNGGVSMIDAGTCACICTNGFTGALCTAANATGCASSYSISGLSSNTTLGDAISRLLNDAQTNFSIPLDAKTVVARFNTNSLSCVAENALVTFDGLSGRVGDQGDVAQSMTTAVAAKRDAKKSESFTSTSSSSTSPTSSSPSTSAAPIATGSGGITYKPSTQTPSTSTSPPTPTLTPTSKSAASTTTSSATSSTPSVDPAALFPITEQVLDFARVAVLFILQEDSLDAAVTAQSALQHFLSLQSSTNSAATNVSLGNNAFANLVDFTLNLGKGTVGGKNASESKAVARSVLPRGSARLWEISW